MRGIIPTSSRPFVLLPTVTPVIIYGVTVEQFVRISDTSRNRISAQAGANYSRVTFYANVDLQLWEARATKGVTPGQGIGLLVGSGAHVPGMTPKVFEINWTALTQGDGAYTIWIYGQDANGVWSK